MTMNPIGKRLVVMGFCSVNQLDEKMTETWFYSYSCPLFVDEFEALDQTLDQTLT